MPDMNENSETQQEYFGIRTDNRETIAELKETLKTYNGCGDWDNDFHTCRVYLQHQELQMYAAQLTKAKELLNEFNRVLKEHNLYHNELYKRAEQFLKDSEVKK